MPSYRRLDWRCAVGLVLVPIAIFAPALVTGKVVSSADNLLDHAPWQALAPGYRSYDPTLSDISQFLHPYALFGAREIRGGRFPLWNPYAFGGVPFFAHPHSATLFPLTALAYVPPDFSLSAGNGLGQCRSPDRTAPAGFLLDLKFDAPIHIPELLPQDVWQLRGRNAIDAHHASEVTVSLEGELRLAVEESIAAVEHEVLLDTIDYPPALYVAAREGMAVERKLRRQAAFQICDGDQPLIRPLAEVGDQPVIGVFPEVKFITWLGVW